MPKKSSDDLSREGEPSQTTEKGLEIPVPERKELFGFLDRVTRRPSEPRGPGKRRSSRSR